MFGAARRLPHCDTWGIHRMPRAVLSRHDATDVGLGQDDADTEPDNLYAPRYTPTTGNARPDSAIGAELPQAGKTQR